MHLEFDDWQGCYGLSSRRVLQQLFSLVYGREKSGDLRGRLRVFKRVSAATMRNWFSLQAWDDVERGIGVTGHTGLPLILRIVQLVGPSVR